MSAPRSSASASADPRPSSLSIVPHRTADPAEAGALVRRDGAAVLSGWPTGADDAVQAARAVLGERVLAVPEPAAVREGGERDRKLYGMTERLPAHTDGFSYGDLYPDVFLLVCVRSAGTGGESFLVDGEALLDSLDPAFVARLESVPVDQTQPGKRPSFSPIVLRTPAGRRALRRFPDQRSDTDPDLVTSWDELVRRAGDEADRFRLEPGDTVVVDNYRCFHGRDAYADPERAMWRVWAWTRDGLGVPEGLLHSDSRFADALTP